MKCIYHEELKYGKHCPTCLYYEDCEVRQTISGMHLVGYIVYAILAVVAIGFCYFLNII